MTRPLLAIFTLLCWASAAGAQAQWTLTTSDFHSRNVALKSIDPAGVHVVASGASDEKVIPYDQFLDVSRPLSDEPSTGGMILYVLGGDHIAGEPLGIKGNSLVWQSAAAGEIVVPLKQLVAIVKAGARPPDSRGRDDMVTLANGDSLHGILADMKDGKLTLQTETGNSEVPLASVAQVNFAATAGSASAAAGFRVRLDDDSSVVASSLVLEGEKLSLSFGKDTGHAVDLSRVKAIEQVNGPVSWLSARAPSENVYTPFLGTLVFPARMNLNVNGDPIRFESEVFAHGIGVHSYSRLSWPLDGTYQAFRTRFAIDADKPLPLADVTVRIKLDDKTVFEQEHVRAGVLSPVVIQDLKQAKKLTLEVDYGANGDSEDRFNWIEPALVKEARASSIPGH